MKKSIAVVALLLMFGAIAGQADAQVVVHAPLPMYYSSPAVTVYSTSPAYFGNPATTPFYSPMVTTYAPGPMYYGIGMPWVVPVPVYGGRHVGRHGGHHWRRRANRAWATPMVSPY